MGQTRLQFQVLGDVSVVVEGERRPITAARQRAALAMLLLAANRTVSPATLIDGIWGVALPQHPDTALQVVVSRLRTSLGSAADRLVSGPTGYRIEVACGELDLLAAQEAYAEGRRLLGEHDPIRAALVLDRALASWESEPLDDLVVFPFCEAARHRLRELRASMYELRNDALLDAGRHVEVLETIEEWLAFEPWRERLRAQHVLALYRSGRQVDALRAFDAYRARVVAELGVEPSQDLCELHRDVLTHAPRLAIGVGPIGSRIPLWTSISLPFVGRGEEEEVIFGRIREVFTGSRMMMLIEGETGIGKTRLVLEIARRVQDDAIVLSVTANDSMQPAVVGLAHALAATILQLPDDELRRCLGRRAGDLAAVVPALRDRLAELGSYPAAADGTDGRANLADAVVSCVTALSRRAPIVLLLDDLHRAGESFLIVLGKLMVVDEEQRVLVLATARTPAPQRSSTLTDLAEQLERHGRLDRVRLEGLRFSSVQRLLVRLGVREPTASTQLLHHVTNGHPYFLSEILQTDDWQRALTDPPLTVREFVRRRIQALGDATEGVLVDAAGLGIAFDVPLVAEIADVPQSTTAALIDGAVAAGVLRTVGKGTFTFVHELCRRALVDDLDEDHRACLHERIATALERRALPHSVLAAHWRLVPGPRAAGYTLRHAQAAGDAAARDLDSSAAVRWYEIAAGVAADAKTRAQLVAAAEAAREQVGA